MKPLYYTIFLLFSFTFSACTDTTSPAKPLKPFITHDEPLLTKYVLGMPVPEYFETEKKVAQEWGINIRHSFAGCVITPENTVERERIEKANHEAYIYYEKKFGKNWQKRFQNSVEKAYQKTLKAKA